MSIVSKLRTWLGLDKQEEAIKKQVEATAMLLDAVKELKEEKKTAQPVQGEEGAATEGDVSLSESKTLIESLQKQVEALQKQLVTAKEDGIKALFSDFKKNEEEKKQKQQKAGRPPIDGKSINLRVDLDIYNMLQFLSSRKALQKTRYINQKLRKGLKEDIEADPLFGSLYREYTKTEKIQEDE